VAWRRKVVTGRRRWRRRHGETTARPDGGTLAASPLILGTDLTSLDPVDLGFLKNRAVLAVDQDAVDASRIVSAGNEQVFAKTEKNGDVVVGLFNTTTQSEVVSTTAAAAGLPASQAYFLDNLWSHRTTETAGTIAADVPAHGVALYRVTPTRFPFIAPPGTTVTLTGLSSVQGAQPVTATESFADNGVQPVRRVRLSLPAPAGWTVTATSPTSFGSVAGGQSVQATFQVAAPTPATLFQSGVVTADAGYRWHGLLPEQASVSETVTISSPVRSPCQTYSSATDAAADFAESGGQLGISGAGPDLYSNSDTYSSVYLKGAVGTGPTVETEVVSQQNMSGFAKAGIMVRDDITGAGATPEGVILFESPSGGFQLEWDADGGRFINSVTPPNGTIPDRLPVWLKLVRDGSGSACTGYYSADGTVWNTVGTATVPGQAAVRDAGMFAVSHAAGSPAAVIFQGFSVR